MEMPRPSPDYIITVPAGEVSPTVVIDDQNRRAFPDDDRPPGLRLPELMLRATGANVRVLVLSSGCDPHHPSLETALIEQRTFSKSHSRYADVLGHGTFLAGVVASSGDYGLPYGVAPGVHLLSAKVVEDDGHGRSSNLVSALKWAAKVRPDVILYGVVTPRLDRRVDAEIHKLYGLGVVQVAAAGTVSKTDSGPQGFGSNGRVMCVGATDAAGRKLASSPSGPGVDLYAWGGPRVGLWPGSRLAKLSGTGPAAALVAGFAAVVIQRRRMAGVPDDPDAVCQNIMECCRTAPALVADVPPGCLVLSPGKFLDTLPPDPEPEKLSEAAERFMRQAAAAVRDLTASEHQTIPGMEPQQPPDH